MPSNTSFGCCEVCGRPLAARHHSLDRHIEQLTYPSPDAAPEAPITAKVLYAESLAHYCSAICAVQGAEKALAQRGIRITLPGPGPIETCSKCGTPVDLSRPHVIYEDMELTEVRQPWLLQAQPHEVNVLAVVCDACDGHLDDAAHNDALRDAEQEWAGVNGPPSHLVEADEKVTPK